LAEPIVCSGQAVADKLNVPEVEWNSAINRWSSSVEEIVFQSTGSYEPSSTPLGGFFDLQPKAVTTRNKSIFVTMQPKDDDFLMVCPIITVQEGDILGRFAGEFQHSSDCNAVYGIPDLAGLLHGDGINQLYERISPWR
jgi:hypothetical protein